MAADASSIATPSADVSMAEPSASTTANIAAQIALGSDVLKSRINALREEQAANKVRNKTITKELKNKEKRRQRLKKKAKQLSDEDLIAVLRMRHGSEMSTPASSAAASSGAGESAVAASAPTEEPAEREPE